jgi:hypothetical protein
MRRLLLWLDTRRLVTAIAFVAVFAMAARPPMAADTWWHLQAGRVTLERGRVLQTDVFSHTQYNSHWINHSWLSQIILYGLFHHFSYVGLGLWMGLVITAAFALVYRQMEGSPFTKAFILILAAATSAVIWSARPQLFSFLLTAVVAYVLYLFKWRRVNRLWLLPPLFVLWVNLHAGYALGFMLLGAFIAGELLNQLLAAATPPPPSEAGRVRAAATPPPGSGQGSVGAAATPPLRSGGGRVGAGDDPLVSWRGIGMVIGVTALSFLLLALNPNTTRMWTYYLDTVRIDVLQDFIQEWRSPDFHLLQMHPFIWLLLATLTAVGLSRRRLDGTDLVTVGLFAYAALLATRNIALFALVAAPVLSRHVAAIGRRANGRRVASGARRIPTAPLRAAANWTLLLVIVALAGFQAHRVLRPAHNEALHRKSLPVDAVEWIKKHKPEGEVFNHYNWGGYLIWRLWPDYGVFVDGRTDLYGDELLRQYLEIQLGKPGFEELFETYDVSFVLMSPNSPLIRQLGCTGGWEEAYRDGVAAVWVREEEGQ